jgi:allantoate deiminase
VYAGKTEDAPTLYIGSHLDTVPNAGRYDGILGVVLGLALVEALKGQKLGYNIEVVGFSEEEGVRFKKPFFGSLALIGKFDKAFLEIKDPQGISLDQAIRAYGLDPTQISQATFNGKALGYLEMHIEQGPVLEAKHIPLGVVEGIVGLNRLELRFTGKANHAGTTPMNLRQDALAGAAEWMGWVEREAQAEKGLVATVGQIGAKPGATNVIPGEVQLSLDVRHLEDGIREHSVAHLITHAQRIAERRGLKVNWESVLDQPAVAMDTDLTSALEQAVEAAGYPVHRMPSGAGHDAMMIAEKMPATMLFIRSPGGISHHPDEAVFEDDVQAALEVGVQFLRRMILP